MTVSYTCIVNLVPQDTTHDEWMYVADQCFSGKRSFVFSADDAKRLVVDGLLPDSHVVVWEPQRWKQGSIEQWLLPCACEIKHFPNPLPHWGIVPEHLTVTVSPLFYGMSAPNVAVGHQVAEHFKDYLTVIRIHASTGSEDKLDWPL